jgi:hypothetical protein
MLQLRVIRAFKTTLEDLEDRRSIHSLRTNRNTQSPGLSNFFYQHKGALLRHPHSSEQPPSGNISIPIPTSLQAAPLNLNDFTGRYMDDDGPSSMDERTNANGQSKETRI